MVYVITSVSNTGEREEPGTREGDVHARPVLSCAHITYRRLLRRLCNNQHLT